LPGPKKIKRPNLAISSFKKGQILKNEKRPNFLQKFVKITKLKFRISIKCLKFAKICQKQDLNAVIFVNI